MRCGNPACSSNPDFVKAWKFCGGCGTPACGDGTCFQASWPAHRPLCRQLARIRKAQRGGDKYLPDG